MSGASNSVPCSEMFVHPQALVEASDIGRGTRVWAFAHVMAGAHIGSSCNICDHAFIESGATLGNNVTVKNGVALWEGVTIEDNVFLGPHCVFTNDPNPRAYLKKRGTELLETRVQANATVGANATILCGITIGEYAFIGAGAVVTRHVPDFALIVGNPGRQLGWMCICAQRLELSTFGQPGSTCVCRSCQRTFDRTSSGLIWRLGNGNNLSSALASTGKGNNCE
jgi:UDP-2-acetamido-3-amino-2,3-dideoxy-glucuronate N-acetyltransferase